MGAEVTAEAVNNAHYVKVMPSCVNVGRMKCHFNLFLLFYILLSGTIYRYLTAINTSLPQPAKYGQDTCNRSYFTLNQEIYTLIASM